ncbi:condensin-2 complex subunit G2 [Caerostris darwini]|uniref:Condensin-2 complex subunit G2 n=1 Tax=Caerostris darwini TaxID=1538125 RepID=A0AAV4Q438_9ARAC|nr:condensin-2 complex subunit G2 [Caerostris darwini]
MAMNVKADSNPLKMNSKIKGKNLIAAVKAQDTAKLVEYASENKSKKQVFTFKKALKDLTTKEIDLLWEDLNKIIIKQAEIIISFTTKGSPNKSKSSPNKSKSSPNKSKSSSKKVCMEVSRIIQASIDIAFAMLDNNLTLSQGLLHMLVFLNFIIFKIPDFLESLKYSIASLCEKMYQLNFLEAGSEQITFNTIIYFIKRTLQQRASKKTVKDVYAMQSFIPKIFTMSDVDVREVLNLYKKCCTAPVYLSMLEGQKIITSILIASTSHITEIQNAIESYLPSAAM